VDFHVSLAGRGDLSARIYRQLLDAILDGRLRPGERLPPTRELAGRLAVSRNTVAVAYDRLTADGFLVGQVGAGTFVSDQPPRPSRDRAAPGGAIRPRPIWSELHSTPVTGTAPPPFDFRVGVPDGGLFPVAAWRRLVAAELRSPDVYAARYREPAGHPGLRAAIARHVGVSRSVHAGADDVLVTQGAQQALDLICRVLVEPGTVVAMEEPGYPQARMLFASHGARIAPVPVDDEGLDVAALPSDAALVYTTPSHQYPLGTPMSLARRTALLTWARDHDAVIVEDDYDSEYRFSERPLEPLQSLDRGGRVLYVGSFSKTLLPILRLGFLVPPVSLRDALHTAKQLADWHGDLVTQGALARFLDEGLLARHLRRATREYAARHERITEALARDLADWLTIVPSAAGLHLCARLAAPVDLAAVREIAARSGVELGWLADSCHTTPAQEGVVIGYGVVDPARISDGMRHLADAFGVASNGAVRIH